MTTEEFANKRFRHSELILYTHPRTKVVYECMLLAVDFEQELFKLVPVDTELYKEEPFWVRVEYCKRPAPQLKKI